MNTNGRLFAIDSTFSGGGRPGQYVLYGERSVRVVRSTVENSSGTGIESGGAALCGVKDSSVSGHAEVGLECAVVRLRATTAVGNGTDPECGITIACADISASDAVRIDAATTCARSYRIGSGIPGDNWGLCTFD